MSFPTTSSSSNEPNAASPGTDLATGATIVRTGTLSNVGTVPVDTVRRASLGGQSTQLRRQRGSHHRRERASSPPGRSLGTDLGRAARGHRIGSQTPGTSLRRGLPNRDRAMEQVNIPDRDFLALAIKFEEPFANFLRREHLSPTTSVLAPRRLERDDGRLRGITMSSEAAN